MEFAIVTATYAGDLSRCRLLCASIDRFVSNMSMHYLVVDDIDLPLFRPLEGPRRKVIGERSLLPSWLRSWPDPSTFGRRRLWTGFGAIGRGLAPLRGWHAQQLRKLALPLHVPEEVLLYADSDVIFLRPYDLGDLVRDGCVRLYRKPGGLRPEMRGHASWSAAAATALGLHAPALPGDDYINNLVSWTRTNVIALHAHIERTTGRDWISAVAARRGFSECLIYGYFVDHIQGEAAGHEPSERPLARTFWDVEDLPDGGLDGFEQTLLADQVAVGVQSFIGEPVDRLREFFNRF
jgi:hypothetical protein